MSECPSSEYVYCANEGGDCRITDTIKEGYMSYGANGRFNLIPFTNTKTDGTDIVIECDNDHGDIMPGRGKQCCVIAADTGFDESTFTGTLQEGNRYWSFSGGNGFVSMRYGTDGRYVYRVIGNGAKAWCNNGFFNDPVRGTGKHCNWNPREPAALGSATWTYCASEGQDCGGLDRASTHWIRYGDNGNYFYRLVMAKNDGKIPCNNNMFDDPLKGNGKYCWRSNSQYSFSGATGTWKRVPSCGGCSSSQYERKIGISELTQSEMTSTWSSSLTATISASYGFGGFGGSVELSSTISQSVTNSITNALTTTTTLSIKYICSKALVYQWNTAVTQNNGIQTKDFNIVSDDFQCLDGGYTPKCPPGYCKDNTNCQQCTQSLTGSAPIIDPNEPTFATKIYEPSEWFTFTVSSSWFGILVCLLVFLLVSNIIFMVYMQCGNPKKKGYKTVKHSDSEYA